jgi:hypothetical protein
LPLLEIEGSSLLRRHPWTPGQAQRKTAAKSGIAKPFQSFKPFKPFELSEAVELSEAIEQQTNK